MADAERASISPRDAAQDPLPERRTSNWEHWELLALAVLVSRISSVVRMRPIRLNAMLIAA